jgi:peptidyl-Asp metalloendopeptidase
MPSAGGLPIALALILAGSASEALAQQAPMSLFGAPARGDSAEITGMRPESVGAVARFSLSLGTANSLRSTSDAPRRLEIALPGGNSVTCLVSPVARPGPRVVLAGEPVGGRETDRCDLVVDRGQVIGDIEVAGGRYRIQPAGAGDVHAVIEVKTEVFPDESNVHAAGTRPGGNPQQPPPLCDVKPAEGQQPKTFGPIRVMFLYTPAARTSSANIGADVELIMQQLRNVFSARRLGGNFSVSVELAHSQEVNYTEADKMEKDLDRLSNPRDAIFRQAHALRDTHKADIVHLLIKNKQQSESCGIGWLNVPPEAKYGFSVSDLQCALQVFSAAHEIGHNIGMNHDRFVVPEAGPGPDEFNFGFVNVAAGLRSLMAYNNACVAEKKNCQRLLTLSSPNVRFGGGPFGRAIDQADAAYDVEVLCRNAQAVSRFR